MSEDKTYNGWKNYETWNVALWISNDEVLYNLAKECRDYEEFREQMEEINGDAAIAFLKGGRKHMQIRTPDGVAWNDSGLDVQALDEMITENKGDE